MIMKEKNGALNAILGLLFPPVCTHCGELLDFRSVNALCGECSEKFEKELDTVCKECFLPVGECSCVPSGASTNLKKSFHAAEYDPEQESVTRSLILAAKDSDYRFDSDLIAETLEKTLDKHLRTRAGCVLTYVPRSPSKVKKTDIDQSKIAAHALSKRTGIPVVCSLIRVGRVDQKYLNTEERRDNAYGAYLANASAIPYIKGKTVILYDDVMTTGATLSACADILKTMGARSVYALTLGRAYKKSGADQQKKEN